MTGIAFEVTADWLLFRSDNPHHRSRSLPRQRFELGWHVRCALIGNYAVDLHLTWLFELNAETEPIGSFSCRNAVFFFKKEMERVTMETFKRENMRNLLSELEVDWC